MAERLWARPSGSTRRAPRLHELELSVAHPGHRDQARMRRRLAAVGVVLHLRRIECVYVPGADLEDVPMTPHRRLHVAHDHRDLHRGAFLKRPHRRPPRFAFRANQASTRADRPESADFCAANATASDISPSSPVAAGRPRPAMASWKARTPGT